MTRRGKRSRSKRRARPGRHPAPRRTAKPTKPTKAKARQVEDAPSRRARLRTNVPPPGWTPEEDRREEQRALTELAVASTLWWPD